MWTEKKFFDAVRGVDVTNQAKLDATWVEKLRFSNKPLSIIQFDKNIFVFIKDPSDLSVNQILSSLEKRFRTSRVNVLGNNLDMIKIDNYQDIFSWYSLSAQSQSQSQYQYQYLSEKPSSLNMQGIEVQTFQNSIPEELENSLKASWKIEYIDKILKKYPEPFRNAQFQSFISQLKMANHMIFLKNLVPIAHCSITRFSHPLLKEDASAAHQWLSSTLPTTARKCIHQFYFKQLLREPTKIVSGIAKVNINSLSHFLKNGFEIDYLAVKRI